MRPGGTEEQKYFNPRSPHGERRHERRRRPTRTLNFNPRSPHGERRLSRCPRVRASGFQPTLPARGATAFPARRCSSLSISTHAPRTGSDLTRLTRARRHGPFQPTLPARGATLWSATLADLALISTHAPRTGSDRRAFAGAGKRFLFQPTLPARGATRPASRFWGWRRHFNPRSPHGERRNCNGLWSRCYNFNPRSPHGERQRKVTILSIRIIGFAQKVYHKTVLLRISLAENAVILPEKPRNPVRTSLQKAGGLRFARAIRAAHPYSISSPSGA